MCYFICHFILCQDKKKIITARKSFYSCEENLDRFGKKKLFKNVFCAFFISFCSDGSFLWLKNYLK